MGFLNAIKRVLTHETQPAMNEETRKRIRDAWGLNEEETAKPTSAVIGPGASAFDRSQWQKKLRRLLEELPASQPHWHGLVVDAQALKLEPDWIAERHREELSLLVRKAVSDRVFSEEEHNKIEMARTLMGLSDAEAKSILHDIVAEAEAFFGSPIKDEG